MKKRRYFNSPVISRREEITSASHPWASLAAGLQSHTQVCSFQSATKSASRLRPLRYEILRNALLTILTITCYNNIRTYRIHTVQEMHTGLCPDMEYILKQNERYA